MNYLGDRQIKAIGVIVALMFLSLLGVARDDRVSGGEEGDAGQHLRAGQVAAGVQGEKVERTTKTEQEYITYLEDVVYPDLKKFWAQNLPYLYDAGFSSSGSYGTAPPTLKILIDKSEKNPGCPLATPKEAMFYCSANNTIYYGLIGELEMVQMFGGFDSANALAHEWGHHAQNQLGNMGYMNQSNDVAFENQADCFAGAWTTSFDSRHNAVSEQDIRLALEAQAYLGDPNTEPQKTHGSPSERVKWFKVGLNTSDPAQCTTF